MFLNGNPLHLLITITWHVSFAAQNNESSTAQVPDYSSTSQSVTSLPLTVPLDVDIHHSLHQNNYKTSKYEEIKHHIVDPTDRVIVPNNDKLNHNVGQYRFAEISNKDHYGRTRRWSNFASWGKKRNSYEITNDDEANDAQRWKKEPFVKGSIKWDVPFRSSLENEEINHNDVDLKPRERLPWGKQLGDGNKYQGWKLMTLLLDQYQKQQLQKTLINALLGRNLRQLSAFWPLKAWGRRDGMSKSSHHNDENTHKPVLSLEDRERILNKRWNQMAIWGKRGLGDSDNVDKRWKQMAVWGKRNEVDDQQEDKRWKQSAVWGKRDASQGEEDKRWKQMSVWGKRDESQGEEEKRWKQMSVWGKRVGSQVEDKRWNQINGWGKRADRQTDYKPWNGMPSWEIGKEQEKISKQTSTRVKRNVGKRWKQMSVWGKRNGDQELYKKWASLSAWGKRNVDPDFNQILASLSAWGERSDDQDLEKKWASMSAWGKRSDDHDFDKRWASVSAWGKRNPSIDLGTDEFGQRLSKESNRAESVHADKKWKQMAVWGKRHTNRMGSDSTLEKKSSFVPPWGKRTFGNIRNWRGIKMWNRKRPSWSRTGFTSWGKRSGDDSIRPLHDYTLDHQSLS